MRIKLISPRMSLRPMDSEYKRVLSPSLALLTLAALTPKDHIVTLDDENVAPLRFNDKPDLVGISVNVDTSPRAYDIARRYRDQGVPVVLGGISASANPEEALAHADAVCVGDAEGVWSQILEDAANQGLKGRYEGNEDLDMNLVPRPRRDVLDPSSYLYSNIVSATRGCPFRCDFCYNSCPYVRRGHRCRPVANVVHEIERLGTKHVMFIDDNLIGTLPWAWELVRALKPLDVTWHAAVSANLVRHPNLVDAMAESGCRSLFIGFESINGNALRDANKRQNQTEQYGRLIGMLHQNAIMVNASLVFGFDEDGPDTFSKTLDWLVRHKVETMTAHILTPYPGTRLFDRLESEGRIVDRDWSHYNTSNVVFTPKNMTRQELRRGYLQIYRDFYSLTNIARRLPDNPRSRAPYLLFNLGYRKFGKLTARVAALGLMRSVGAFARRLSYGIS